MQWDQYLTNLYASGTGLEASALLLVPAIILRIIAWYLERKAVDQYLHTGRVSRFNEIYSKHKTSLDLIYNLSNGVSILLIVTWFMLAFGFIAAMIAFLTSMYVSGLLGLSLERFAIMHTKTEMRKEEHNKNNM